jgi:hypothetical protein
MHDIHGPGHLPEAAREIGANGRIEKLRQQKATRQKRRHPTPGKQAGLEPKDRDPAGLILIVAPGREQSGVQQIPVALIRPLSDSGNLVASFPKQSRDGVPMQLGASYAGVVGGGGLNNPHGITAVVARPPVSVNQQI